MIENLPDGSKQFKKGVNISWAWSGLPPDRVLTITVTGTTLTTQQKNAIQNRLNSRFGTGKITVVQG